MNNKRVKTKAMAMAVAAAMAVDLCPVTAFAVTGSQVAEDGTYTATGHVTQTEDDDPEDWGEYDVTVSLTVKDGKFEDIKVTPGDTYDSSVNKTYLSKAYDKPNGKGIKVKLAGQDATEDTITGWDTVSGATRTSAAIKQAALAAIQSAPEKTAAVEIDTTALETAIAAAEGKNEADYTADSWAAMQEKLTAAKAALTAKTSQEEVTKAATELDAAVEALVKAETKEEYKYVYAALSYQEYWSAEGVQAAGNGASSDTKDTHGEYDKGAFDAVTRATANHGLHRGNFQQDVTIYDTEGNAYDMAYWDGQTKIVLTDGTSIGFSRGTITLPSGETKTMATYKIKGIKYVPVQVAAEDYDAFKAKYTVVENGETLAGGYSEGSLKSYSGLVAEVDANTNGLKKATKNADGTFSFGKRQTGTGSGIQGVALQSTSLTPVVQSTSSYGDFIRMDVKENYGEVGAKMQTVVWTYYGDGDTPLATYGTKFAADNWMHKSMGIQLGLTDSMRCNLPAGKDGTGKWTVTIFALGYADTTMTINVTADDIHAATPVSDTSKLEAAIARAEALNKDDYTEESWSSLETELKEAKDDLAAAEKGTTSQENVDESTEHLNAAIDALVKAAKEGYKYVYAALSYQEYWSAEDVQAAGDDTSSDTKDTHGEYDKGAFDAVTRATTNHGLHRGNFQQDVTIYDTEGNAYEMSYWDGKDKIVLTDGTSIGFGRGTITLPSGETKTMATYEIKGIKYVPVQVAEEDYDAFKAKYTVVENGETLAGGYSEGVLSSYSGLVAEVDANTNGLKKATKNADGTFSFGKRQTGTGSGIKDVELQSATLTPVVQESSSYGDFIRMDVKENYGEVGSKMQTVVWTYYGDGDTPLATYGTKFAADNWMHKSMGIQLGLTDSLRCNLPAGKDGTGKWTVTIYALGYADTTMTINVTADDIHAATPVSDTSKLEAAIAKAEALNKDDYTEESWSSLETELKEAKDDLAAAGKGTTSQESVDESTTHLNAAIEALVKKPSISAPTVKDVELKDGENSVATTISDLNLPDDFDAEYTVEGADVEVQGNKLILKNVKKGTYTLTITDKSGKYDALSTTFEVYAETMPAAYNEDSTAPGLVKAAGSTDAEFADFLKNITSVTVNGTAYPAREGLIKEDGTLATDAAAFANGDSFEIVVSATGYKDLSFTYKKASGEDPVQVNTASLEKAIQTAEALKEADYTADSWKVLQTALKNAKSALEAKKDQTSVDNAAASLNKAIEALVKAGAATTTPTPTTTPAASKNNTTTSGAGNKTTTSSGSTSTSKTAKTGDPTNILEMLGLAVASLGTGGFALKRRKRNKK